MAEEQTRPSITALVERLRDDGYTRIADAITDGDLTALSDDDMALVDSAVYGFGILISGHRENPLTVRLIEYAPAERAA